MRIPHGTFLGVVSAGAVTLINPVMQLPRSHLLTDLIFTVSVTVTNTGTVVYYEDALARAFRFRLYLSGSDPDWSIRGDNLKCELLTYFQEPQKYTEVPGTAGSQTGTWVFRIPIADSRILPDRRLTRMDLALAENPRIEMDFPATAAALSAGTTVITACSVVVEGDYDERPANLPGFGQLRPYAPIVKVREIVPQGLVASVTDQQLNLPTGRIISHYTIIPRDTTTPLRSDTLISKLEFSQNFLRTTGKKSWASLLMETRAGLPVGATQLTGVVCDNYDPSYSLNGAGMRNLSGTRDMAVYVDTGAFVSGMELSIIERSIIFPDYAAVFAMAKALGIQL